MGLARQILLASRRASADHEDAVQVAFHCFFRGLAQGRFPQLRDRHNLWRLLVVLTVRKTIDHLRREARRHPPVREAMLSSALVLTEVEEESELEQLEHVASQAPTPALAAELIDLFEHLLQRLEDPTLRQIALWRLEGYTNGEIADKLGCTRRTVIRKLDHVRQMWSEDLEA